MNPFYFGTSAKPLYGVYHPPRGGEARDHGVVLCYPMGQEYMRAHRAFRQLALLLSKRKFHVMRFDYYGTGDSAGDDEAGDLDQWTEDISTAVDELRDTANVKRVSLIGLRVGAALATDLCARRDDIDSVVMWDPIWDGRRYLEELLECNRGRPEYDIDRARAMLDGPESIGIMGFPVTARMRSGLHRLDLLNVSDIRAGKMYILGSSDRDEYRAIDERIRGLGVDSVYRCVPSPGNWGFVDNNGSALLPQAIIQGIVESLAEDGGK